MSLAVLEIYTDEQGLYNAGENVTGRLVIQVAQRFKISYVRMALIGYSETQWIDSTTTENNTELFQGYDEHFNREIIFLKKRGKQDLYLEAGDYSFAFDFMLPHDLPSSFEHTDGYIRYSLTAVIGMSKSFNKETSKLITVKSRLSPEESAGLEQPYSVTRNKKLGFLFFKSNPIEVTLTAFKTGFTPGETIPFTFTIVNNSATSLRSVQVNLVQEVKLHSKKKTRTSTQILNSTFFPGHIAAKSTQEWSNFLPIPSLCPSTNNQCRTITLSYYLELRVDPSTISKSFTVNLPIFIDSLARKNNYNNWTPSYGY